MATVKLTDKPAASGADKAVVIENGEIRLADMETLFNALNTYIDDNIDEKLGVIENGSY